ncbi:gamma-butyrobetaine dioxygenase [Limimonas halophila]|uniref:Gamma-butyrobetaine dioxygenase n=1 Tax=Limimonas halophila TaxID=1082479 RepID=A0A1G7PZN0_9PROT|nr:TauD/TfdA family dioxygenase [Limimonas halophila]SDF91767.1 gamma-butyrobetaine dioxygenase [Limimonas halophila]
MIDVDFRVESQPPRVVARTAQGEMELPALWLRERCQDAQHLDPDTEQRLFDPHQLPDDLTLTEARDEGQGMAWLAFSDGYAGRYRLAALTPEFDAQDGLPAAQPWDGSLDMDTVRVDWSRLGDREAMRQAVGTFLAYGFVVLYNVPTDSERILEVARTFGHPRETNFGTYFEVYSRPHSNDLAYRPVGLGAHTDNPYREPVPGIQLLHCLVNETSGGLSTLVDSLAVAEQLRTEDPEGLELLATTPVRFRFTDENEELIERRTIVNRDATGRMTGVHYSPRLDYLPVMDPESTRRFQRARRRLGELFADPAFEIRFPLGAGELMMFDNSRVLHGRTAYDPREGFRHLQGCYIDLDGPRSLYRSLGRSLRAAAA